MGIGGGDPDLALDILVAMGALGALVWLGDRVSRTALWVPLLVFCGGIIAVALLHLGDDLAERAGAGDLAVELQVGALSAVVIALAGGLHFAAVYPRRVTARWLPAALLAMYGLAVFYVLMAPTRITWQGAGRLVDSQGPLLVAIGYVFYLALLLPIGWFAFLALRGRNDSERKAARSLTLATGPPVVIGFLLTLLGIPVEPDTLAVALFGLWLIGVLFAFARRGLPLPLAGSMRRVNDSSADAIVVIGSDATIVAVNKATFSLLGIPPSPLGKPFEGVLAPAFKDAAAWSRLASQIGAAILAGSQQVEEEVGTAGPQGRPVSVLVDPLRSREAKGRADGVVVRVRDVTAAKVAQEAAVRATELQDLVIRVMGHDLKAPLTVVSGYLELSHKRLGGPLSEADRSAVQAHLAKAVVATTLMREVMVNARAISRITMAGASQAPREATDLSRMVDDVVEVLRPLATAKQISMTVERPDSFRVPLVPGFESVISNLVSNAIKYTPPGGEVAVSVAGAVGFVRLEVADTGPGIPVESRGRLFRKFERLALEQSVASHGLGLSITAAIVELSAGRITVIDRPDGRSGALFRVEIPTGTAPLPGPVA